MITSKPFTVVLKDIVAETPDGMTQQEIENAVAQALVERLMILDHESTSVSVPIQDDRRYIVLVRRFNKDVTHE